MLKYLSKHPWFSGIDRSYMIKPWKENGPIVIAGIGGSGTRLIAQICSSSGVYLGDDLNRALDNLTYTLLFRRYRWFMKYRQNQVKTKTGLRLLEKMLFHRRQLSLREAFFLGNAVLDYFLHYRQIEKSWAFDRLRVYLQKTSPDNHFLGWGWKEPNSYLLLPSLADEFPNLKFIHTIRNGLDMAFSKNQRQMKNWSALFIENRKASPAYTPVQSLKFWIAANQFMAQEGEHLGKDRYLQVNYDQVCRDPEPVLQKILAFLELDVNSENFRKLLKLPQVPASMGRYKSYDLAIFDKADLDQVEQFGFSYDIL
jgi:hypothetical protein